MSKLLTGKHEVLLNQLLHIYHILDHGIQCYGTLTIFPRGIGRTGEITWSVDGNVIKLEFRWLVTKLLLEFIDLVNTLDHFLMAPFVTLDV